MVIAIVQIAGFEPVAGGQIVNFSGTVTFTDTLQADSYTFPVPIASLPAPGDLNSTIALATTAVQALTGRTVDRVMVSGWAW